MAALGLVLVFDLATPLALSDEWMFRFPLQSLRAGHGFQLWPGVLPLSLVQLVTALPLVGADPRFWRLAELPYLVLAAGATYALANRLGAGRFWSSVGAALVTCAPVTLSVATGFTSDIAYLGLLMLAAWLALRWAAGGGLTPFLAVSALATLQRQHGFAIVLALSLAVLLWRRADRRHLVGLGALWLVTLAALTGPFVLGISSSTMNGLRSGNGRLGPGPGSMIATLIVAMPMLGMFFMPLAPALWRRPKGEHGRGLLPTVAFALAVAGVAGSAGFAVLFQGDIWPGNVWGYWGLGPTHLGGSKPPLLPIPAYLFVEVLSVLSFVVILARRRGLWQPARLGFEGSFLVLLALGGLLPMPFTSPLDRYFIQAMAPLAPLLVLAAAKAEVAPPSLTAWPRIATVAALLAGVVFYAAGQQDYVAWQQARDAAARLAYARLPAQRVEAGYEAVATYAAVPEYLRTGRLVIDPIDLKPPDPVARLVFAPPGDPRPGAAYSSLSPGRVVIVCLVAPPQCPFPSP